MADEPKDATAGEEEGQDQSKKKKKKIVLYAIVAVVLLLLAGGGYFAYSYFMAPEEAISEEGSADEEAVTVESVMFELEPFTVNLADPRGNRYLKVKMSLEIESAEQLEKVEKAKPKMRDMVIMLLTSLSFEEVMTPEGKIRVRDELLERFNLILRPVRVKNIYFTEFVIQ